MLHLKVTPKAEADLMDIWPYTFETWNAAQADDYVEQIERGLAHLTTHPSLGVDYGHILARYRKLRIKHHDVFYQVREPEVLVIRVLHEDMDARPAGFWSNKSTAIE